MSTESCRQRSPAGLPSGIPGIGDDIEGAMQQAPQPGRHSMNYPMRRWGMTDLNRQNARLKIRNSTATRTRLLFECEIQRSALHFLA